MDIHKIVEVYFNFMVIVVTDQWRHSVVYHAEIKAAIHVVSWYLNFSGFNTDNF